MIRPENLPPLSHSDPIVLERSNRGLTRRQLLRNIFINGTLLIVDGMVSACGAAPLPPQGPLQQRVDQVDLGTLYKVATSEPSSVLAGLPVPTTAPTRPIDVAKPSQTPRPSAQPQPTPNKGIHEKPKPTALPIATKEPTPRPGIYDSPVRVEPLMKHNAPKNSMGDPVLNSDIRVEQKVREAIQGKLPGNIELELKRHILFAGESAMNENQRVTVSHPNVYEANGYVYGIEVTRDPYGNMDLILQNMSNQLPTEIQLSFYNAGNGETEVAARIFTKHRNKDGFIVEDKQLDALRHTLQMIKLVHEVSPSTTSGLTRFRALWPGYTAKHFGTGSNAGAYEAALRRIAMVEIMIQNPNETERTLLAQKESKATESTFTSFMVRAINMMLGRRTSAFPERIDYWSGVRDPVKITAREYMTTPPDEKHVKVDFKFGDK